MELTDEYPDLRELHAMHHEHEADWPERAARGIVFGLLFSLPMWLVIIGAAAAAWN